jgi:hypothetical protein
MSILSLLLIPILILTRILMTGLPGGKFFN